MRKLQNADNHTIDNKHSFIAAIILNSLIFDFKLLFSLTQLHILFTAKEEHNTLPAKHGSCGDCRNFVFTYVERMKMNKPTTAIQETDHPSTVAITHNSLQYLAEVK